MYDIEIDQGATEELLIEATDVVKAVILVSTSATAEPVIEKEAIFTDGSAQISLLYADTNITPADYVYQIRLFDESGEFFNLENQDCVIGDCTLSKFIICPSIPATPEVEA